MTTAVFYHPSCLLHGNGEGHPERPGRLQAVIEHLWNADYAGSLEWPDFRPADRTHLSRVHLPEYLDELEQSATRPVTRFDADTQTNDQSYQAALYGAGAAVAAVDAAVQGRFTRSFVAVRPPGHHAVAGRAMGFCLINNVAVAAAHAIEHHKLHRVAIVDWDVHHGNGTERAFWDTDEVFYISLHQHPHYPGTGRASDTGDGPGLGYTLNIPLPAGSGEAAYFDAVDSQVLPALDAYRPELILVSAGFDAHQRDPLAGMLLDGSSYRGLTQRFVECAQAHASGRIVHLLEGGYDLPGLVDGVDNVMRVLAEVADAD